MAVTVTPEELAKAMEKFELSYPNLTTRALAECLLVDVIATRLQNERESNASC
jgi:hypothetical protein